MTEPPYSGPPPTGLYRPPPLYPPPYGPYPSPYSGPPYPIYPPAEDRPSTVLVAAVLGWIASGLLVLAAGLLFFGAAFLHGVDTAFAPARDAYVAEFTFDGIVDLVAAGVLIAGAAMLTSRGAAGRMLLTGGAAIVLVEALYWLIRWTSRSGGTVVGYAFLFASLALVSVTFAWSRAVTNWLTTR